MDKLAHGTFGEAHRRGHLRAAAALDSSADQGLVLSSWKTRQCSKRVSRVHPCLGDLLRGTRLMIGPVRIELEFRIRQGSKRRVTEDLMQPASQMPDFRPRPQRRECVQECLLDEILSSALGGQPPRERMQGPAIALHDRRECAVLTSPGQLH
jgi:hypothetical protein